MFGTLGFSELIIILAIVLIIFGAGKLPQIGEGLGKALKGFKKEIHDIPPPEAVQPPPEPVLQAKSAAEEAQIAASQPAPPTPKPTAPYTPGPELTPGTTAALMANLGPQPAQSHTAVPAQAASPATPASAPPGVQGHRPPTMEERLATPPPVARAQYPPLPPSAQPKPVTKRPSAIVNKEAVARVQAQQAALKQKAAQQAQPASQSGNLSPQDMQSLGSGLGDALRTFRQAVADVRNTVDPEMRTIQAELDAAQKEIEQSIEAAKQMPAVQEEPPKPA